LENNWSRWYVPCSPICTVADLAFLQPELVASVGAEMALENGEQAVTV